jgi:thiol-disulfide isomerase/thioredoxin
MKYLHAHTLRRAVATFAATAATSVLAVLAFVLALTLALPTTVHAAQTPPPKIGDTAPDFVFVDVATGKPTRLSAFRDRPEFRGKPVVLDFWATWCGPCIAEFPTFTALHAEGGDKKFVLLSISIDANFKDAQKFVAANKMTWHQGHAPKAWNSEAARKYGVNSIPSIWLIGTDGKIAARGLRGEEIKNALRLYAENKLKISDQETWKKVSGRVVNKKGEAVAGAKITLSAYRQGSVAKGTLQAYHPDNEEYTTDKNGVWTCERIFANAGAVQIHVFHPDYAGFPSASRRSFEPIKSIPDFYAGKTTITLKDGMRVTGIVKDEKGKPVAGAEVSEGFHISTPFSSPASITNKQGEFKIILSEDQRYNNLTISAKKKGYAPDAKPLIHALTPTKGYQLVLTGIELVLKAPQTIKGIVVNENGKPLQGVSYSSGTWKNVDGIVGQWESKKTGKDGRFEIKDAPEGEVSFDFSSRGYARLRDCPVKAGAENKVVLLPPTQINGKIVDADTGEQIKKYTILRGVPLNKDDPNNIYWDGNKEGWSGYSEIKIDSAGNFQNELNVVQDAYFYSITKEGYYPAISTPIKMNGKKQEIVIKLRQGKRLAVKVVDIQGHPVANADVAFQNRMVRKNYDGFYVLNFLNGKLQDDNAFPQLRTKKLVTDAAGIVTIPPQTDEWRLVIAHDAGRAIVSSKDLNADKPVVLTPWERIKGKSFTGKKPNAGAKITYYHTPFVAFQSVELNDPKLQNETSNLSWKATAVADENGNFEIKHALPKLGDIGDGTLEETVRVINGEVLNIQLGGKGRVVEGKVIFPADPENDGETSWGWSIFLADAETPRLDKRREGKRTKAEIEEDDITDYEWKKKRQYRWGSSTNPDGTFRIANVLPGKYYFTVSRWDDHEFVQTFVVPADPDGTLADTPLVLPALEAKIAPKLSSATIGVKEIKK